MAKKVIFATTHSTSIRWAPPTSLRIKALQLFLCERWATPPYMDEYSFPTDGQKLLVQLKIRRRRFAMASAAAFSSSPNQIAAVRENTYPSYSMCKILYADGIIESWFWMERLSLHTSGSHLMSLETANRRSNNCSPENKKGF